MPLLPRAPKIDLLAPRVMRTGETHALRIVLTTHDDTEVRHVDAAIEATTRVRHAADQTSVSHPFRAGARFTAQSLGDSVRSRPFRHGERVSGATTLPAGRREIPFAVQIPQDAPPSYAGTTVSTTWTVSVRVGIPFWPDPDVAFEVHVTPTPMSSDDAPLVASTAPDGPTADEAYLECSLASRRVPAGGHLDGSLALGNVEVVRYRNATVALVGYEVPDIRHAYEREAWRHEYPLDLDEAVARRAIPFRLAVPSNIPPSWSGAWRLRWAFEMRAGLGWMQRLEGSVPIVVVPAGAAGDAGNDRFAPPAVGSERLQAVWREVAERVGLETSGDELHGTLGLVNVVIRRVHEGRDGIFLVGEVRYPSLALGLSIQPWRRFTDMLSSSIALGHDAFDRRHRVSARDARGATLFGTKLVDVLSRFDRVVMGDDQARLALRDAGHRPERLRTFAADVLALAHSVSTHRAPYR
ncbi:MAG: hypothetical protein IT379_19155 [Deltaproteobacteria bacterium]|nr:hypothetical protein [Deltaproteobacteria bacterium]